MTDWPVATLDPIRRARVLAATVPNAAAIETVIDAPFQDVWPWMVDFERSVPEFDTTIRKVRVHARRREGHVEHVALTATGVGMPVGLPCTARVEDGFCIMQGRWRLYLVVMAAAPTDGGAHTRFVHMEAIPLPGSWLARSYLQRVVRADVAGIHRRFHV
jgi:hypothetical protein